MELPEHDADTLVRAATSHLRDEFPDVEEQRIERVVRSQIDGWSRRAKVKSFVGIIAERHARAELAGSSP